MALRGSLAKQKTRGWWGGRGRSARSPRLRYGSPSGSGLRVEGGGTRTRCTSALAEGTVVLLRTIKRYLPEPVVTALRNIRQALRPSTRGGASRQGMHLTGMTSQGEQQFYTACAEETSDLDGAIVDLGCWMCSTAISLAMGVDGKREGGAPDTRKVYAFDRFIWEPWMDRHLPSVGADYEPGETFLPEARRRIRGYGHIIELVQADLSDYVWQRGPVRILLVDAMKSWQLARSIATSFFPSLVEHGVLIHQDFKHFYTPWIHILQYRLRDHFRLKHDVADGGTVAFETVRPIPVEVAASASQFSDVSDAEVKEAMVHSMACVRDPQKSAIAAAHLMYFVHGGRAQEARELLAEYSAARLVSTTDFCIAKENVEGMDG